MATLQLTLNALYGAGLVVDGSYGSKTTAAVYAFQARYGLTYDGRVGPETWRKLDSCYVAWAHGWPY